MGEHDQGSQKCIRSMLLGTRVRNFIHEVLTILMTKVTGIVNSFTFITSDPDVLFHNILL